MSGVHKRGGKADSKPQPAEGKGNAGAGVTEAEQGPKATAASALAPAPVPEQPDWLSRNERFVPALLLAIATFTRFYRLDEPPGVVFDETHFGRFTGQYLRHEYFFDIHPPLAKLVLWAVALAVGYDQSVCKYDTIGESYSPECKFVWLRAVAATHSSLSVPLLYGIVRGFGGSVWAATAAAGLLILDMVSLTEGRLLLLDAQLQFWCIAVLFLAQRWWLRLNEHTAAEEQAAEAAALARKQVADAGANVNEAETDSAAAGAATAVSDADIAASEAAASAASDAELVPSPGAFSDAFNMARSLYTPATPRAMGWWERHLWLVLIGVVCANAFSVKMTGLATPGIVAVESFFGIWFLRRSVHFPDLLKILVVAFFTYAFYFRVHFAILTHHGDGDEEFMTLRFQSTLINSVHYDPKATWEGFWWTFFTLNKRMVVHNAAILEPHPWQSKWHEWVLNQRGVSYYGKDLEHTYTNHMYLIGNHVVHYAIIAAGALFAAAAALFLRLRRIPAYRMGAFGRFFTAGSFCVTVYCLNLAPYVGVARSTFIYHYMPAMVYGQMLCGLTLELLAGKRAAKWAVFALLGAAGATYLYYWPWIYALPLTSEGHARRRWLPRWD